MCLAGASRAGAELLAAVTHPDLRAYYVWVPMLPPDDEAAAAAVAAHFAEPRALHYWDGQRRLARELGEALLISARDSIGAGSGPGFAWDVYLAYPRGAVDLTRPAFWMHHLAVTHAPRLDAEAFRSGVERLLAAPPA
jgi:hypothetical protein